MSELESIKPRDLGVTLGGSARKGHNITLSRADALSEIFGTADADQANAFLSHCLKVLKPDEAGDAGAANDERHFLLSIIRDMAPRDPVERMLARRRADQTGWHVGGQSKCDVLACEFVPVSH